MSVRNQPFRRLFEEHGKAPRQRTIEKDWKLGTEAELVCQQSVERFRRQYNFDVEALAPILEQTQNNYADPLHPVSLHGNSGGYWKWEMVDPRYYYVPAFYHTSRHHSDSCLLARDQTVPVGQKDTTHGRRVAQSTEEDDIPSTGNCDGHKQESGTKMVCPKTPSLFNVWQPHIRKRSLIKSQTEGQSSAVTKMNQKARSKEKKNHGSVDANQQEWTIKASREEVEYFPITGGLFSSYIVPSVPLSPQTKSVQYKFGDHSTKSNRERLEDRNLRQAKLTELEDMMNLNRQSGMTFRSRKSMSIVTDLAQCRLTQRFSVAPYRQLQKKVSRSSIYPTV